jgi:hypothetical protein
MVDLFGPFGWRIVRDGFDGQPPVDSIDRAVCDLQDRPPGGFERDLPSLRGSGRDG